ncbi:MAG: hypothetical protein KAH48_06045, partial [Chlorobi bacterium]|nr:hypothetical protein [Chlorobiota bacterium]
MSIVKTESINKTEILNTSDEIGKKEITTKTPTDIVVDSNDDCCKLDADQALDQDLVLEAVPADEILIDDGIDDKNQEGNNQEEKPSEVKQGSIDKFIENIPDEPNVGGVVYLELTIEEMEKIGIKKINDSYNFRFQDSSPDTGSKLERGLASILSFIGINTDNVFYECSVGSMFINHKIEKGQGWGTREVDRTLPVSVTVYESHYTKAEDAEIFGHTIRSYENNWESPLLKEFAPDIKPRNLGYYSSAGRDGEYSKKFDRLVPLSIFYGDPTEPDSSKLRYGNIQIWYIATKELAELLPPRYSEPILKELALLTSIENGMIPLKEACREMEDQTSYFNMCTMTSRTIEYAKVYPNPVSDQLTCKFELNEASNIRIALFAQSGSFIKYLNQTQKLMSGVHS